MSAKSLALVVEALVAGQVVAVPTDTVYGFGVDARQPGAVDRLFELKMRPSRLALPVLVGEPSELCDLAVLSQAAQRLVERYWPGPLTLVLPRRAGVVLDLRGDPATIGVRCPAKAELRELLRLTGPLAVTSANRSGTAPLHSAQEVREQFGDTGMVVLDGGRCDGVPSSVVSLVGDEPKCLREGPVAFGEFLAVASGELPKEA